MLLRDQLCNNGVRWMQYVVSKVVEMPNDGNIMFYT